MTPIRFLSHHRIHRSGCAFVGALALASALSAQILDWDPDPATGIQGGAGTWDTAATHFTDDDGASNLIWPNDSSTVARFGSPSGSVTLVGALGSGGIVADSGYDFLLDVAAPDKLEVYGDFTGGADVKIFNKINRYEPALLDAGVHFYGGSAVEADFNFTLNNLQSSPILGAHGTGTVVRYQGDFYGNGGQSIPSLVTQTGGRLVLTQDAFVELILSGSAFTRQLWVYGDGSGALELEEGFVADTSGGITVAPDGTPVLNNVVHSGLGSIRQSHNTIITHHTQNLPVGLRPDGSGGYQVNGHFVFEDEGGSAWQTRTNPQTYIGAVWIGVDLTIDTGVDTTHAGVTTFSSHEGSYWADNAFQTTAENVTLTKTGPANLILAEETAFLPGAVMNIEEGGMIFRKDPAAGPRKGSGNSVEGGPHMELVVGTAGVDGRDASVRFEAPLSRIESLSSTQGRIEIFGEVQMAAFSSNSQDDLPDQFPPPPLVYYPTILKIHLDTSHGWLNVSGAAAIGGELLFTREPGFEPPVGTSFDVLVAGTLTNGPNGTAPRFESYEDRTGLGLLVDYLSDRVRVTTTREASSTGLVIDEDWTDGAFDVPGWSFADGRVGFTATGRPGIPMALTRPVDTSFIWNAAVIDVPPFRAEGDDVLIIKMTTFSDVAYNNQEFAKPEVACLHLNEHAQFGHDHANELSRHYYTVNSSRQLFPNVENDGLWFGGIHVASGDNAASLVQNDTSLAVFRPGAGSTDFEVTGMLNSQQQLYTGGEMQHWNNILISLPRGHDGSKGPVYRSGTSLGTGFMGMSKAHVGVTKRTDANLDYATDALDFIHWNSYRGSGSGMRLQWGDFDNDGDTDGDDYSLWESYRGQEHDPVFHTPQTEYAVSGLPGTGSPPTFSYDYATGAMTITTDGSAVSAWAVEGPAASSASDPGWWHGYTAGKQQAVDASLVGLSGSGILVATYPAGLGQSDFGAVTFGYASGGGGVTAVELVNLPYDTWADGYGLVGSDRDPSASPADDGIPNIVKYGLGNDPTAQGGGWPPFTVLDIGGDDYFAVEFTRPSGQSDLTTEGEISTDLTSWSSAPEDVDLSIEDNGNGTETVTIRATIPMSVQTRAHLRAIFSL